MTLHNRARIAPALLLLALAACDGGDDDDPDASTDGSEADASVLDGAPDAAGDGGNPDAAPDPGDGSPGDPDGSPDASPFACDPVSQTGCGDGEKCDLAETGSFGCVADGNIGEMARCDPDRPNACVAGFTCRDTDYNDYRCARLCRNDDHCRAGDRCDSRRMTGDGETYLMCATVHECQPFVQDCIDQTRQCALSPVGAFCLAPRNGGPLPDGSVCRLPTDCQVGSACLDQGRDDRCVRLCDPEDSEPGCAKGQSCTRFTEVGPQPLGVCGS